HAVRFDEVVSPEWTSPGRRELTLRATWEDGESRAARFVFDIVRLGTPAPNDTLFVTASVPYGGSAASGRAYVYLAEGHASIENPIVIIEGFDIDDTMTWERLYELLNQENLLEDARAEGFDAVVLDFNSATDPIQRNAFLVAELLQQVAGMINPSQDMFLVGASMGGLCSRYALAWMESQSIDSRVRTFLSFDTPHGGANVPLGIQYWLDFFSDQSSDAAYLLSRLDMPAARQMLVAHHTSPPGNTAAPDPLRATFLADLASVGNWPANPRLVAAANGNGFQQGQGFAPAAQIISYTYRSFLVDIDGDVWALPNQTAAQIFHGRIDFIFLPTDEQFVNVSGTPPWDNAPGGTRDSMFQMDTTAAPYGDIVALYPSHCFIPTVSALALPTADLFFDVAGTPDVVSLTPFNAIHWAATNEEHVFISPETKAWVMAEIESGATGAPVLPSAATQLFTLLPAYPNPVRDRVEWSFSLTREARVSMEIFDARGRRIMRPLIDAELAPGAHLVHWNPPAGGVYFYRLRCGNEMQSGKVTALGR
ncbi:MAG TPA: T9SS type A sorting domain-containing protein, partial [bacterium]|nr:T9SS type A sorting domain-containing protein [bacterium]